VHKQQLVQRNLANSKLIHIQLQLSYARAQSKIWNTLFL